MAEYRFSLDITHDEYLAHYSGAIHSVVVTARDGRRVQFPAVKLRPFVTHTGIVGEFVLVVDDARGSSTLRRG